MVDYEQQLNRLLDTRISRRQFGGAVLTVGSLLLAACKSENKQPPPDPLIAYTPEQRTEAIKWVKDLTFVLNYSLNQSVFSVSFDRILAASDTEVSKFLAENSIKTDYGLTWKVKVPFPEDSQFLAFDVDTVYDQKGRLGQWMISANLVNVKLPRVAPYIDSETKTLIADGEKLKEVAKAVFTIPEGIKWITAVSPTIPLPDLANQSIIDNPLVVPPSDEGSKLEDAKVTLIHGVFDEPPFNRVELSLFTDGNTRLTTTRLLFDPLRDRQGLKSK